MNEKISNLVSSIKKEQQVLVVSRKIIKEKIEALADQICSVVVLTWKKHFDEDVDICYENEFSTLKDSLLMDFHIGCESTTWPEKISLYLELSGKHEKVGENIYLHNNKWYYDGTTCDLSETATEAERDEFWSDYEGEVFKPIELNITTKQFEDFLKEIEKITNLKIRTHTLDLYLEWDNWKGKILE